MASIPSLDSYTALKALRQAALKNATGAPELPLPERPRLSNEPSTYSEMAIGMVGIYTAHLYDEYGSSSLELTTIRKDVRQIDKKVDNLDKKVDSLDKKVDNLDQGIQRFESGAKKALTSLSGRLNVVEEGLKELRKEVKDVRSQINNMQRGITNTMALQVNGLRQRLFEPIEPISTPMQIGDEQIFRVPPDFPVTIREFWQLRTKIPTLVKLASHYSVSGWE